MAKHTGKLTKRVVEGWKYDKADPILWDGNLPGYGVRANANGTTTALVDYRDKYQRKRRYTLGKVTEAFTADQARKKAESVLREIKQTGADPMAQRKADQNAATVNDLIDAYLESEKFKGLADSTQYADKNRINRHLRPTLGKLKLQEVKPEDVRRAHRAITEGKTACVVKTKPRGKAVVRGGEGASRQAIRVLRAMFSWAVIEGYMEANPASGIRLGSDGEREAILETPEQYESLFRALDKLEAEQTVVSPAADAIRVLALTGARKNEIAAMRWEWVDLKRGVVTVPPKFHKGGHRSGKAKEIALPAAALVIIQRISNESEFVFPGRNGTHVSLGSSVWKQIRKEAGLSSEIGNHSLRHSLGTLMAVQGAEAPQIMAALGHTQIATSMRYVKRGVELRRSLIDKHTSGLAAMIEGKPKGEVVELKRGAKRAK